MADTDILEVFLKLSNPEVFDKIESLKKGKFEVDVTVKGDGQLREILAYNNKSIKLDVIANTDNAIKSLRDLETQLKGLQSLGSTKINLVGDLNKDLEKVSQTLARLELQAKNINTVGVSNAQIKAYQENPALLNQALRSFGSNQFSGPNSIQPAQLDQAIRAAQLRNVGNILNRNQGIEFFQPAQGVQLPLDQVKPFIQKRQNEAFQQQIQIANRQLQEEAIEKYRAAIKTIPSGPFSLLSDKPAPGSSAISRHLASLAPQTGGGTNIFGSQLGHIGLGILAGQGGGALRGVAGLLGGVAGSTFGPVGATVGSLVGGALFEGAAKSIESVTRVFEDVAKSGIEFQSTIVALTGVLQANTDAFDSSGNRLDAFSQTQASQAQARAIQQAARSELLPLGIGGDAEATLVQGLFSGFSQRGIVLDAEQTKTISGRLGAAIVSLAPQILQNPVQLRKDVEDIGANSPNAGRTTLGVALKNLTPDLFRSLATGDDIIRATERLEQFKTAIQNSDQATVQLLRLSGGLDKLRTTLGDSFLQGLQPGIKTLADILSNEDFEKALAGFGKTLGQFSSFIINLSVSIGKAVTDLITKFPAFKALGDFFIGQGTPETPPNVGNVKPKPDTIIGKFLRELGIDSIGESTDNALRSDPRFRLAKLQQAERETILAQNGDLESKFLPGIFLQELDAARGATQAEANRVDTFTYQGRRDAAFKTLEGTATQRAIGEKALQFATFKFNEAQASGNEDEAFRQASLINKINDDLAQTAKEAANASRELITATLDETRALQGLRNATESVKDAQFNQVKQLNELNRSLAAAKDEVEQFGRKAASAFASKEEQLIDAAIEYEQAGGVSPFGGIETLQQMKKDARLQGAGARLNELLGETGNGGIQVDARGGQNLIGPNSIFANALEREKQALEDSIDKIIYELDKLPRALRDAIEALEDLRAREDLKGAGNVPNTYNYPGLPPGFGSPTDGPFDFGPGTPPNLPNPPNKGYGWNKVPPSQNPFAPTPENDPDLMPGEEYTGELDKDGNPEVRNKKTGKTRFIKDDGSELQRQLPKPDTLDDFRRTLQGGISGVGKTIPGFSWEGNPVIQNYPGDYDSEGNPIPVRGDDGNFSIDMGPLGAVNAILGGPAGIPTDISSGLFNSDGSPAQPILNSSDVTNKGGSPFYSAIVGGLQDSKLRNNIRPQAPAYYNEQTPGGIPFGGSKVTTESSILPAIKELIDTVKQQGDKTADDIRKGIESSFGGK